MKKKLTRDAEASREKILNCAAECFAETGFHGTVVDEILKKANVNKQLIYYYFGSKENLYREVHLRGWQKLQDWFAYQLTHEKNQKIIQENDIPKILLESVRLLNQFIAENIPFQRLVTWDALEGGTVTRSLWETVRKPMVQHFEGLLSMAQEMGLLSKTLDIQQALISILGVVTFYFVHSNSLEEILSQKPLSKKALQKREEQVLLLVEKILEA